MAGKSTVSISVVIKEGKDGLKQLTLDADGLRKAMSETVKVAQEFQNKWINVAAIGTGIRSLSESLSQLTGVLSSVTAESLDFSKAMKAANTMAGKDSEGFEKLKDEVAELSKEIPIARDQLANGLYQVISNGVPEDNWIEYLKTSARSAVGGLADINRVVGVTATVIKNYGLEWNAAADIQDKIQLTAKNGVTSFEQLAQALPRVTGNAATLGVTVDELMGTFATLTGVSGNTAEVSTQLAAIFTALVKPSSEAAEMAAKMGIQFDAAAIKAAGGFQNFLQQLDSSIKAYAAANGVLEQEVYGRLFGSAEALRALIPLQGELADKFASNIADMVNSAGTMDAAYNDMASTGEAAAQRLQNKFGAITDFIAGLTEGIQPMLAFASGLLSTAANVAILAKSLNTLNITQMLVATRAKLVSSMISLVGLTSKKTRLGLEMLAISAGKGAAALAAFKIALRGILLTTGVGVAIWAVTEAVSYLCDSADKAADETKKLDDCTDTYVQSAASAQVQIDKDVKALGELIKSNESTKEAVQELNRTYGDIFGTYKTAAEWYKVLTEKSGLYVKQVGYEAQARALAAKKAEAAINLELATERRAQWEKAHPKKLIMLPDPVTKKLRPVSYDEEWLALSRAVNEASSEVDGYQHRLDIVAATVEKIAADMAQGMRQATKEVDINKMTWQQVTDAISKTETSLQNTIDPTEIKNLRKYNDQLKARKNILDEQTGLSSHNNSGQSNGANKKGLIANPMTEDELNANIRLSEDRLTGEDTEEQRKLIKDISLWKEKVKWIELAKKESERPTEFDSIDDYDREIEYQRALKNVSPSDELPKIEAELERLTKARENLDRLGKVPPPVEEITTYEQLNSALAYYTAMQQTASATGREETQKHINELNTLKNTWDDALESLEKPGDIATLDTVEKLEEAIRYYQVQQNKATADEVSNIQKTIDAHERKLEAMKRGISLQSMQREVDDINELSGREYKIKISGIGFDGLTEKIRELQKMLDDVENPPTDKQREKIEKLKGTYEQWRKECAYSFGTFRSGWDGIKGIGGGIESLTSALEGNGNAWQKITGIVDGFLQIYDGIAAIVSIINKLTRASRFFTVAKTEEAGAVVASAAAQTAEAAVAEGAVAAQAPVVAANKAASASFMELAAASYFAAHAYIPFAGFGIASGFVAAATTIVKSVGKVTATPFANGGIVSGPTIGLIGEYAGASNNPEVVAPLDKLRSMMQPVGEPVIVGGTLRASGRELVCVLANETRIASKSGKRTNIKI